MAAVVQYVWLADNVTLIEHTQFVPESDFHQTHVEDVEEVCRPESF